MTRKIYGLVGTPQSAKTKINELFPQHGIEFINLNAAGNKMRALGSPDRAFFDFIVPGHLFDDGIRRPSYYLDICKHPDKLEDIMKREIPIIEEYAREMIATTTGDIILSWEYLYMLSPEFQFDQVILLICQDEDTWFDRLRFRANERGFPRRLSDRKIKEIIKIHGFREIIEGSIARWNECLIVDTSPEDFGAENLEFVLSNKFTKNSETMKLEPIELSPEKLGFLMGLFDLSEEEITTACNCTEVSDVPEVKKVESAEEAFSGLGQENNCPACRAFMRQYIDFMNSPDELAQTYENICDCEPAADERILIIRKAATLN